MNALVILNATVASMNDSEPSWFDRSLRTHHLHAANG